MGTPDSVKSSFMLVRGESRSFRGENVVKFVVEDDVALCLYDPSLGVGAVGTTAGPEGLAALADALVRGLVADDARVDPRILRAKVVGAASLGAVEGESAVRAALAASPFSIEGVDAGGAVERDCYFYLPGGRLRVWQKEPAAGPVASRGTDAPREAGESQLPSEPHRPGESSAPIRVLVVDDSPSASKAIVALLSRDPGIVVVGVGRDGIEGAELVRALRPDVLSLDLEMPRKDGLGLLADLMSSDPLPVVIVSSLGVADGDKVLRAMELGAVDYAQKPRADDFGAMAELLRAKIRVAAGARIGALAVKGPRVTFQRTTVEFAPDALVVIGASTGGTQALRRLLTALPAGIPPIVIVQHIPANFSRTFAESLDAACPFSVKEGVNGQWVGPGQVVVAPGGYHMELERVSGRYRVRVIDAAPRNRHKPSVDVLFDSVVPFAGPSTLALLLTGMGNDGAAGLLRLRQAGARTIAQDEQSCVVFGMPREAIALGAAERVCSLEVMPHHVVKLLQGTRKAG